MNHYPHHIGDFNSATRHISRDERWFYRDLIEIYYDYEKPLPDDFIWVCRKLMATTEQEEAAVEQVLVEFFVLKADGWHNSKCDEVLADYHANLENKSIAGKASAAARAKKNKGSKGNSTAVQQKSTADNNLEPRTKNHLKDIADLLNYLNEKSGREFRTSAELKARLSEGRSVEDIKLVIDYKVKEWLGTPQAKFIRPSTLFRPSKFEGYLNDAKQEVPIENTTKNAPSTSDQVRAAIQAEIAKQEAGSSDLANDD